MTPTGTTGWAGAELRAALIPLLGSLGQAPGLEPKEIDSILSRILWSRLVEPGDAVAGTLIGALGARTATELLCEGKTAKQISERCRATRETELTERAIAAGLRRWAPRLDHHSLQLDLERARAAGMRLLTPADPAWPHALDDLGIHAPLVLWVRGKPEQLSGPKIAIVGARACTGYGAHVTSELAGVAGAAGATVVSGAAYGIDAVAHRTALAADHPTIAVLAGGADRAYPSAHSSLLRGIADTGVVCSEMVPGAAPTRWRFLQRNRVIAALSHATLVTEAGLRSGSLNTAGHAATLGRPLGAVPGPVTSAASAGCHRLIRDYGAALVTNEQELRELLGMPADPLADLGDPEQGGSPNTPQEDGRQPPVHRRVIDALPLRGGHTVEDAARLAGVGIAEARSVLAELELLGHVRRSETPEAGEVRWALQRRE